MSIITNDADIKRGVDHLSEICPHMRMIGETCGPPPLRWREPGFSGLVSTITAQQLSVSSATAIRNKLHAMFEAKSSEVVAGSREDFASGKKTDPLTPEALLAATEEDLRACGLSGPKIRTLRALAEAIVTGALPFNALHELPVDEAKAAMVAVHGIGPWTAEVYMMFCLGVQDIFAPADLALQEAAKLAMGLDARPTAKQLDAIAIRWAPWRAVAARMLWAYYGHVKRRQGVIST